jgi:hypothetical protein
MTTGVITTAASTQLMAMPLEVLAMPLTTSEGSRSITPSFYEPTYEPTAAFHLRAPSDPLRSPEPFPAPEPAPPPLRRPPPDSPENPDVPLPNPDPIEPSQI